VLLVLGHDVLDPRWLADETPLAGLDTVVLLDTHHSDLERVAHVVLPARHAAEKLGTLTNHAGRVQRVVPAVEPAHPALAEGEWLARLGAALGLPGFEGGFDARLVSKQIGAVVPAFAGLDVDSVGDAGLPLRGEGDRP
jgi:predicted molibdopterin-dependent oxidoreductase YjgC